MTRVPKVLHTLPMALTLALSACSYNDGWVPSSIQTQVLLSEGNYRVVASGVEGGDKGYVVFGMGGSANYHVAMNKLRKAAGIERGSRRALVNLTVDEQTTYLPALILPIVVQDAITISADVIEFAEPAPVVSRGP